MITNVLRPIHQYRQIGTATAVGQADPHQLILLLFDGAIASLLQARHALETGDGETRRSAIAKAMRIIDEGLKAALEPKGDPTLAANLGALYEHMVARLFQANLRGEDAPLAEVAGLLGGLRATWAQIAPARPTFAAQVHA